jgi:hypothetical protein
VGAKYDDPQGGPKLFEMFHLSGSLERRSGLQFSTPKGLDELGMLLNSMARENRKNMVKSFITNSIYFC